MASEDIQMMPFPSSEMARKHKEKLDDGKWHRSFIRHAVEFKKDVIPVFDKNKTSLEWAQEVKKQCVT